MIGTDLDEMRMSVTTRDSSLHCPDNIQTAFDRNREEDDTISVVCTVSDLAELQENKDEQERPLNSCSFWLPGFPVLSVL